MKMLSNVIVTPVIYVKYFFYMLHSTVTVMQYQIAEKENGSYTAICS